MNFLDAAFQVLTQAQTPLHYTEIARRALEAEILTTRGQTPEASMGSRLYVDTKRSNSRFKRVSRGVFALVETAPSDISQRIQSINQQTRKNLRKRLLEMPPERFEALVAELLFALGFEEETVYITSFGNDGGVDVRGVLNAADLAEVRVAVQAKRWKNDVSSPTVQALRGSLTVHEQGIIITTSGFSSGAIAEAEAIGKARISLIDGNKLLDLLFVHKIGVTAEEHTVYSIDLEWWDDVADEIKAPAAPPKTQIDRIYPIKIQAISNGVTHEAELLNKSGNIKYKGKIYASPSAAGKIAAGWTSCSGWDFWKYQSPATGEWQPIQAIRDN